MTQALPHADWIAPDWPAPDGVRALVTTRSGGVSEGLFASMNLGDHVGDAPAAVEANRQRLALALGARPVFMKQVHGTQVIRLDPGPAPPAPVADGAFALAPGPACVVMVADCLPILLAHRQQPAVAALHAGWRGLAGEGGRGILEAGLAQMQAALGLDAAEVASGLVAWLGPCIGPQAFEVGPEVRQAFMQVQPEAAACFQPGRPGRWMADLPGLARQRLQRMGVQAVFGNDGSLPWCTASGSRFFSHRRTSGRPGAAPGDTGGRLAACIWLT